MSWTVPQPLFVGQDTGSTVRPGICDFNGRLFVAWPTMPENGTPFAPSFSFTSRNTNDDGWNPPQLVSFRDSAGKRDSSKHQDYASALVVFKNSLYALVPVTSASSSGLDVFLYDGSTFNQCSSWAGDWHTDIAATVANDVLYVIGHRLSDSAIIWTYSSADNMKNSTGPPKLALGQFEGTLLTGQYTRWSVGLTARHGVVVALYLGVMNGVVEMTLDTTGSAPAWTVTDYTDQVGMMGVSAVTTPDNAYSWIGFKSTQASCIDICHYKFANGCYDSGDSLGDDPPASCANEPALCWSGGKVYAVWNTNTGQGPLHFRTAVPGA